MTWFDEHDERRSRTSRTLAVAAMIGLAGTVLAGCGDDDDTGAAVDDTEDVEVTETEAEETEMETDGAEQQVTIDIVSIDDAFEPSSTTVAGGGEVTWVNSDGIGHTTTAEDGTWDSGNLDPGAEFSFTPEEPGTYAYFCSIHPSMTGELVVE